MLSFVCKFNELQSLEQSAEKISSSNDDSQHILLTYAVTHNARIMHMQIPALIKCDNDAITVTQTEMASR